MMGRLSVPTSLEAIAVGDAEATRSGLKSLVRYASRRSLYLEGRAIRLASRRGKDRPMAKWCCVKRYVIQFAKGALARRSHL